MERQKTEVKFYDSVDDSLLKFAVILAKKDGQWIFCKHRDRDTFEVPGGHREPGEDIHLAACFMQILKNQSRNCIVK